MEESYQKLKIYKKAKSLILLLYKITKKFPLEEKYSLVPQIRRAVISILANVVEGYSKNSKKDFARFLGISIGSATELNFYPEISLDLGYISKDEYQIYSLLLLEVRRMLYSFQSALRSTKTLTR